MCSSRVASEYIVRVYVCASTACVCVRVCACVWTMYVYGVYECWGTRVCVYVCGCTYVRTCVCTTCVGGYGVCAHWCMFMYVWVGAKPCMHMCIYMCVVQGAAEDNSPTVSLWQIRGYVTAVRKERWDGNDDEHTATTGQSHPKDPHSYHILREASCREHASMQGTTKPRETLQSPRQLPQPLLLSSEHYYKWTEHGPVGPWNPHNWGQPTQLH